jgi:hypothetical protein
MITTTAFNANNLIGSINDLVTRNRLRSIHVQSEAGETSIKVIIPNDQKCIIYKIFESSTKSDATLQVKYGSAVVWKAEVDTAYKEIDFVFPAADGLNVEVELVVDGVGSYLTVVYEIKH